MGRKKGPPSKDSSQLRPSEVRSRMTRAITEISTGLGGDARATLDRYLTVFNHIDKPEVLPVTLRPHHEHPLRATNGNAVEVLFHMVGTMVVRYWAFAKNQTLTLQREWDTVARQVEHIARKGWGEYTVVGNDEHGYRLMTHEQADRLSGQDQKREREKRGG